MGIEWRVGELTARRGWGPAQLARSAHIDIKTARNVITGRASRVDLETIARIAQALEVTPGALWQRSATDPRKDSWLASAGAAGTAGSDELDAILAGEWGPGSDPALERATRVR